MNDNQDSEKEASFQSRLLRVIFRWVLIFAVSALVLYGAFWAATHPNNRIALIFVVGVIVVILLARVTGWQFAIASQAFNVASNRTKCK